MIKVIIFDLDGVLVDTKMIHFEALNLSLKKYGYKEISIDDHVKVFDGLPTNEKLKILNKKDKLPIKNFSKINKYKQKITASLLKKKIKSMLLIQVDCLLQFNNAKNSKTSLRKSPSKKPRIISGNL